MPQEILKRWMRRESLSFLAGGFFVTGVVLLIVSIATAVDCWTIFGTALGPDFTAMYVAGTVLNEHGSEELYNFALQHEIRHALVPGLPSGDQMPYLYAPWFAQLWRPLAALPYEWAFACWIVTGLGLFVGGVLLLLGMCRNLKGPARWTALLIALSFEPFLFECWINGQVATIPFLGICLSLWLQKQGRAFSGGVTLAACLYKPTQGVLIFAMLLLGRRWRELWGTVCGGLALCAACAAFFGPRIFLDYPAALLAYREKIASGDLSLRLWKYVDVRSCAELLGDPWQLPAWCALAGIAVVLLVRLAKLWRQTSTGWNDSVIHAWCATLVALPALNVYFGICDAILMIPGVVLAIDLRCRQSGQPDPAWDGVSQRALLLYVAAMIAPLYESVPLNLFTLACLALAWSLARTTADDVAVRAPQMSADESGPAGETACWPAAAGPARSTVASPGR